jgi:uncharacterized protein (DUF427 family)
MKAKFNETVIAESDRAVVIEGNYYFPPDSVKREFLRASEFHTSCPRKGEANYYSLAVNGNRIADAAWYYPNPGETAEQIKNYIAFWKGVKVVE